MGHRLFEVRLVRRANFLYRRRNASNLSENGGGVVKDWPANRLQPLPVRTTRCVEVGTGSRRESLADHRRYSRHVGLDDGNWISSKRAGAVRDGRPLERS